MLINRFRRISNQFNTNWVIEITDCQLSKRVRVVENYAILKITNYLYKKMLESARKIRG